jgi:ABC-2 type transport system permease protein
LLTAWATATFVQDEVLFAKEVFLYSSVLTAVFVSVAGIVLFTSEAQHGTLPGVMASQTARWVIVLAKSIVAAGAGLLFGVVGMSAGFCGALLGGLEVGDTSALPRIIAWSLTFMTASGVLGVGVGLMVRNTAAAVSGLLVWSLVIENLLREFLKPGIARFMPFNAGNGLLNIPATNDTIARQAVQLTSLENALVFGGFMAATVAVGTALLYKLDA